MEILNQMQNAAEQLMRQADKAWRRFDVLSSTKPKKTEPILRWKMKRDVLPLYGPGSGMPSAVETHDSERFCDPGTLG